MTTPATNKTVLLTKDAASPAAKPSGIGVARARADVGSTITIT